MIDRFIHSSRLLAVCTTTILLLLLSACKQDSNKQSGNSNAPVPTAAVPSRKDSASAVTAATETVPPSADQPLSMPFYPEDAKKRKEEGSVVLKLHVLSDGSIDVVDIAESSGFPQLDEYAVREARTNWRLKPGTVGGQPTAMWHNIKVTFKLD